MSTTYDDIAYEQYQADQHEQYIEALEKFASSRNIDELKENLDLLKSKVSEWAGESFNAEKSEELLKQIKTLENIYDEIITARKSGRRYFWIGLLVGILGTAASIIGTLR